jgi:hypothetical protein
LEELDLDDPFLSQGVQSPASVVYLGDALHLVFVGTSSSGAAMRWVNLETNQVEAQVALDGSAGPIRISGLLNEHVVVGLGDSGQVYRLEDPKSSQGRTAEDLISIAPIWDDPETEAIETPPERFEWRELEVTEGVGWAFGTNVLARVLPDVDQARSVWCDQPFH